MDIIKIIWRDARTIGEASTLEEIKSFGLCETHTIGYLIHEDKEKIIVCSVFHKTEDEEYQDGYKETHIIPKSIIKKIVKLKEIN